MLVRMRVDVSGTRDGEPWPQRGSVLELPDHEAAHYCQVGLAEPVTTFGEVQTATVPEPELRNGTESTRTIHRGRPRTQKAEV